MIKKPIKIALYAIFLIAVLFVAVQLYIYNHEDSPYEAQYFQKAGVASYNIDPFIAAKGEPEEDTIMVQEGYDLRMLYYPGYVYCFTVDTTYEGAEYAFSYVEVTDPECKFGRKKIGVGSSISDVIKAYKGIQQLPEYEDGHAYSDSRFIIFEYDDDDLVEKITIKFAVCDD